MICGAKTRSGGECQKPPLSGKRRCRLHGGLSLSGADHPAFIHGNCTKEYRQKCAAGTIYLRHLENMAIQLGMIEPKRRRRTWCSSVFGRSFANTFATPCKWIRSHWLICFRFWATHDSSEYICWLLKIQSPSMTLIKNDSPPPYVLHTKRVGVYFWYSTWNIRPCIKLTNDTKDFW